MSTQHPVARYDLEFIPVADGEQEMFLVRDPLGLVDEGVALLPQLLHVLSLLDGARSLKDLQKELIALQRGEVVTLEEVAYLVDQFDQARLLESEAFFRARWEIVREFEERPVRPPLLAGQAYPEDPAELGCFLDDILTRRPPFEPAGEVAALAAPHIDPGIGEAVYGRAYGALLGAEPDRVLILGVGHQLDQGLFCLTRKDFETPLGAAKCDVEAVEALAAAGADILSPTDFPHRFEHSIEFQVLFLQRVLTKRPFTIVPVLCGSLLALPEYNRETYVLTAAPFLDALGDIIAAPGQRTLVAAGVDFSHIGPKFGHERTAEDLEAEASAHDRKLLARLTANDPDGFWEESRSVEDRYNVCGFSALACLLEIMPPRRGMVLDYALWREEQTRSAVSFAACVFTADE